VSEVNRQWLLKRRPEGNLSEADFEYKEADMPSGGLKAGEIKVRNVGFLCAPTMRNWMDPPSKNLYPSIPLGQPIMAPAAARVVASASEGIAVGDRVLGLSTWQDYAVIPGGGMRRPTLIPEGISFLEGIGRYGLNPMTAYFGLLDVGAAQSGETLVVSGAAGSTGSTAAQIGKVKGMTVIGIAGSKSKCDWLTEQCGIDGAIDYKSENVEKRLSELCPKGINVFYDNVGGEILQAAINNMAPRGRIVLCGQISSYDNDESAEGPRNMMRLVYGSIRMQGFLCGNYADRFDEATTQLKSWTESGQINYREDLRVGFENLPNSFRSLFDGSNIGTLLVQIDDSATETT
jgi:NADPH-dependent curcumin reductase CurA